MWTEYKWRKKKLTSLHSADHSKPDSRIVGNVNGISITELFEKLITPTVCSIFTTNYKKVESGGREKYTFRLTRQKLMIFPLIFSLVKNWRILVQWKKKSTKKKKNETMILNMRKSNILAKCIKWRSDRHFDDGTGVYVTLYEDNQAPIISIFKRDRVI